MGTLATMIIRKARPQAKEKQERFHSGVVRHFKEYGPYTAEAILWTGEPGSGRMLVTKHKTEREAMDELRKVYNKFPNHHEDAVIFYGGYDLWD